MLFVDCAPRLLHTSKHNSSQEYVRLRRRTVNIKYLQHGGIYCCRQNDVTGTHVCSFCFSVILLLVLLILFLVSREAFQAVPCCQQVVFCVLCSFMTSQPCVDTQLSSWICRSGTIKLVAIALFIRINGPFDMAAIKRNHVSSLLRNRVSKRPWHSACGTLIRQWIIIYHHPHYLSSSSGRARWTANLVALCLWRLHSCFRDLWPSRRIIHSLHALQTLKLTLFYCFFVVFFKYETCLCNVTACANNNMTSGRDIASKIRYTCLLFMFYYYYYVSSDIYGGPKISKPLSLNHH